jgi:hypothetical protein
MMRDFEKLDYTQKAKDAECLARLKKRLHPTKLLING